MSTRQNMTGLRRWYTENCAKNWNLTILPNCIYTNQNPSSKTKRTKFSMVLIHGLVSLFNGISTLFRLFNAKAIILEEQYYVTHSWEDKGVHTFPKGIFLKVNIIARLENELAYYDSAVHRFNHYTTRTPPL